jgi:hypothetical protein
VREASWSAAVPAALDFCDGRVDRSRGWLRKEKRRRTAALQDADATLQRAPEKAKLLDEPPRGASTETVRRLYSSIWQQNNLFCSGTAWPLSHSAPAAKGLFASSECANSCHGDFSMKPHAILDGFEDARIVRFVFDQPTEGGEARITFVLEKNGARRGLLFTVPHESIQFIELLMPPSLEIQDHSDEGWESSTIEVTHPYSGSTYFYASHVEEIAVP